MPQKIQNSADLVSRLCEKLDDFNEGTATHDDMKITYKTGNTIVSANKMQMQYNAQTHKPTREIAFLEN